MLFEFIYLCVHRFVKLAQLRLDLLLQKLPHGQVEFGV